MPIIKPEDDPGLFILQVKDKGRIGIDVLEFTSRCEGAGLNDNPDREKMIQAARLSMIIGTGENEVEFDDDEILAAAMKASLIYTERRQNLGNGLAPQQSLPRPTDSPTSPTVSPKRN